MLDSFLTPLSSYNILYHNDNNFQLSQILKLKCQPPQIYFVTETCVNNYEYLNHTGIGFQTLSKL
jgi:hypothetical protein